MKPAIERMDLGMEELKQLLERAREVLSEEDYRKLKAAVDTLGYLTELVADKETTIRHLRQLLLPRTEKTSTVLGKSEGEPTAQTQGEPAGQPDASKPKQPGHGRNGANAFEGARKVKVVHEQLKPGDRCPECPNGKVYAQKEPKTLVRIVGQAPMAATVYELDRLRCNLCGEMFTAEEPEGIGPEKYDETVASMVAQLKYGSGMPFNRLEDLERRLGVPLPASTQWEIAEEAADLLKPAHEELIRQAAQGEIFHNDDTSMKVLKLERPEGDKRTGVFTTGIVSVSEGDKIALFMTGRQHAGENLGDVLEHRDSGQGTPIQM